MTVTGLIPCAGQATRMDYLPKFLLPVAEGHLLGVLTNRMRSAGAASVWVGANKQNAAFIKPYAENIALKGTLDTKTMCETVLVARDYCGDDTVLLGLADTYWTTPDVYELLAQRVTQFGADVAVALWHIRPDQRGKLGVCAVHNDSIYDVVDKDENCLYEMCWGAMAWSSRFWDHIKPEHTHLGFALQSAIKAGLRVKAVQCMGSYYDAGTKTEYFQLCSTFIQEYAR